MPVAVAPNQLHRTPMGDVLAFGYDVQALLPDSRGTRGAQVGESNPALAYQLRPGQCGSESLGAMPGPFEEQPAESPAVGKVSEPGVGHGGCDEETCSQHRERLCHVARSRMSAHHGE